jgi:hypothetical protein
MWPSLAAHTGLALGVVAVALGALVAIAVTWRPRVVTAG